MEHPLTVSRSRLVLKPDASRVLFRPFLQLNSERAIKILSRIMTLSENEVRAKIVEVMSEFEGRHQAVHDFFMEQFDRISVHLPMDATLSAERKLLVGSYFTHEYSLESAALFNPSIMPHPDQTDLREGNLRFVISLRATGDGHVSSITFRTGTVGRFGNITLDKPSRFITTPRPIPNATYQKALFERKLFESAIDSRLTQRIMSILGDQFTLQELESSISTVSGEESLFNLDGSPEIRGMLLLARSNYEVQFSPTQSVSERVIFPHGPRESNGIEDARFVQFCNDDGTTVYYATYTAYDGKVMLPQLLQTEDFLHFKMSTLNGPAVANKGMALFPRKINGRYAMLSRQDNENIFLMFSDTVNFWSAPQILVKPTYSWEFVQLGNCGSPLETEAGWLVLTHGVGPMRKYSIGALLLDIADPSMVIGRLQEPLLTPDESEREGYVPNVVYSCGSIIHNGLLILPYAMSDYASSFGVIPVDTILNALK